MASADITFSYLPTRHGGEDQMAMSVESQDMDRAFEFKIYTAVPSFPTMDQPSQRTWRPWTEHLFESPRRPYYYPHEAFPEKDLRSVVDRSISPWAATMLVADCRTELARAISAFKMFYLSQRGQDGETFAQDANAFLASLTTVVDLTD